MLQRRQQSKRTGKAKRGKRGNKAKNKRKQPAKEASLDDVPLESFRIVQDTDRIITEYLMAVYSMLREWGKLRGSVQKLWREVHKTT